jgi:YggT family protein
VIPQVLCAAIGIYLFAVFGRIILSWFPVRPGSPVGSAAVLLERITEPVLGPARRLIPPIRIGAMGLDVSAMLVVIVLQVLRGVVC